MTEKLTMKSLASDIGDLRVGLGLVTSQMDDMRAEREAAKQKAANTPYTESDALQRCTTALQNLEPEKRNSSSYGFGGYFDQNGAAIKRILRYLADRFNVELVEIREQPCSRPHVDDIQPDMLINAVRNSVPVIDHE